MLSRDRLLRAIEKNVEPNKEEAEKLLQQFFEAFPELSQWMREEAKRAGC